MSERSMSLYGQEFYDLCARYLEIYGRPGPDDYWIMASLGRMTITKTGRRMVMEHVVDLQNGDAEIQRIWSPETGFVCETWYEYLEKLRTALILDRLADV